jgi:signal transduction histidine kinase
VTDVQFSLATAGSLLSDYFYTGDAALLERFNVAVEDAERHMRRLEDMVGPLGPEVARRRQDLELSATRWQSSIAWLLGRSPSPEDLATQQAVYEDLLLAAAHLDNAITAEAVRERQAIARAERTQLLATAGLGVVALGAALVVIWLTNRLHEHTAEAIRARAEIQRLMESKARLIRGFSHDLKNPLGAADGYAELLEQGIMGPLAPAQRDALTPIRRLLRSAVQVIEDLVELSRAEAGGLELRPQPLDIGDVLRELGQEYTAGAAGKGLTLAVDVDGSLPVVRADRARLRQVLGNLVSNAIKYTRAGSVTIAAETAGRRDGHAAGQWVAIHVRDTGPGIPEKDQETVFDEFARLDRETAGGSGLGLAISRRIARLMKGEVTLASRPGEGSTFTLWLPCMDGDGRG